MEGQMLNSLQAEALQETGGMYHPHMLQNH